MDMGARILQKIRHTTGNNLERRQIYGKGRNKEL